jgi:uncharacterized protein (TIGR04222 family)
VETWGISGPLFLVLDLIIFGACLVGAFYTQAKVRSSSARMSNRTPSLDVYDTAYLAGGPDRVIDTAVAGLADIGRIRVGPEGRLTWVGELARQPVESAVSERVNHGVGRLTDLRQALRHDPALTDIGKRLSGSGLIADESTVGLAQLAAWSLVVPFALGVIRLAAELMNHQGLNVALALLLLVLANGLALVWFTRHQRYRTWYGESVLRSLEQTTPPARQPGLGYQLRDPLAIAGAATVALFGFAGIYDRTLREALQLSR